jgi:hypothetical protein
MRPAVVHSYTKPLSVAIAPLRPAVRSKPDEALRYA